MGLTGPACTLNTTGAFVQCQNLKSCLVCVYVKKVNTLSHICLFRSRHNGERFETNLYHDKDRVSMETALTGSNQKSRFSAYFDFFCANLSLRRTIDCVLPQNVYFKSVFFIFRAVLCVLHLAHAHSRLLTI